MMLAAALMQSAAIVFWTASAAYAVLASQPFAYEQMLRPRIVPELAAFADAHTMLAAVLLLVYGAVHVRAARGGWLEHRMAVGLVTIVWALVVAAAYAYRSLAAVSPETGALTAFVACCVLLVLIALVDLAAAPDPPLGTLAQRPGADFAACLLSAIAATVLMGGLSWLRGAAITTPAMAALISSLTLHLVLFAVLLLLLMAVRALAAASGGRLAEAWMLGALLAGLAFVVLWAVVLPGVVSDRQTAALVAVLLASTLTLALAARGWSSSRPEDDALTRLLAALAPAVLRRSRLLVLLWLIAIGGAGLLVTAAAARADWNFIVARLGAVLVWTLVFAAMVRAVEATASPSTGVQLGWSIVVLALFMGWHHPAVTAALSARSIDRTAGLEGWIVADPATRLLTDALRPPALAGASDMALFDLLQRHTNVPAATAVDPVPVSLAPLTGAPAAARPHIFLFVIDSLRRDYLGAYREAVTFTPAIDRFARENVRFTAPFTRYGATGLSVPSIWAGGMLLHKQYVTPFPPMNALARLLDDQRYAQWIGMDNIMEVILPASSRRAPLDQGRPVAEFRFCRTLREIEARLAARAPGDPPVFVYTLPQDIHVATLTREGRRAVDERAYDGFYAPVASRVRRMDACFGAFVEFLQGAGLYDDSLVVLTSDHGDSLGEAGRMGHGYTVYPEIVQVPLIVHLPRALRAQWVAEDHGPVFTTDITPTLYALLAGEAGRPAPFFGRPLFRAGGAPPRAPLDTPVIASSYGAVYGVLQDDARRLFIFDGINLREEMFDLDGSGAGRVRDPSPADRAAAHTAIRNTIEAIARFYNFSPD